jgi:hypothetical protein
MTRDQAASLTCGNGRMPGQTFFRLFMPYLYQRVTVPGRKHAFLPLNRNYLPLGMRRNGWVDYKAVAGTHAVFFSRDPSTLADVWWNQSGDSFWLYDDSAASRIGYFERLQRLMLRQPGMTS